MEGKKLKNYKTKLEKEKEELLKEIKSTKPEDFGGDIDHYDEEADEAEDLSLKLGISQELKDRLEDVNAALQKMDNGKYGACENCGKEIEDVVLNIEPASRYCKNCKKKASRKR